MTKFALALLTTVAALSSVAAADVTVQPVEPAATSFMVGTIKVTALRDAEVLIPNDAKTFGVDAGIPAVAAVLKANGIADDAVPISVDALLVRVPGHVVVIDTGLGPKTNSRLIASLALAGVGRGDVTDVLVTHSHGDHVGGLDSDDDRPAFPNAKVRMAAAEWAYMSKQPATTALADALAPQVETFTPGEVVVPGITSVAIAGHTPGHVGYVIESGRDRLLDIGDAAHSTLISLGHPEWTMGFDGDKAVGTASRRALLADLAKSHGTIFAPHFPFPGIGTVAAKGSGFVWQPAAAARFTK